MRSRKNNVPFLKTRISQIFLGENHPVQRVSWNDARDYLQRLNTTEKTDRYRLPTEPE